MGQEDDWDDDDAQQTGTQDQGGKNDARGLRSHANRLKRENEELQRKLAEFETAARTSRVKTAVEAKGLDAAIASIVPETVAGDDAALEKWLNDNEKLFAKAQKETDQTVDQGFGDDALHEDQDGYMRVSRVTSSAIPVTQYTDTVSAIKAARNREDLDAIMRKHGNKYVDQFGG